MFARFVFCTGQIAEHDPQCQLLLLTIVTPTRRLDVDNT